MCMLCLGAELLQFCILTESQHRNGNVRMPFPGPVNFLCSNRVYVFSGLILTGDQHYSLFNARFTLADPMPRLASDVVGGKSGRNHPTSRRHHIHIGRMARNA